MYNGVGIANVGNRSTQIGDEPGDTITMNGWYVCNGQESTPNLVNKFVRGETSSGNIGGNDSPILTKENLPPHNHTASSADNVHTHNCNNAGEHNHRLTENPGIMSGNRWNAGLANDPNRGTWRDNTIMEVGGSHSHSLANDTHNHSVTIDNTGDGVALDNKPNYYSLVFIIKMI